MLLSFPNQIKKVKIISLWIKFTHKMKTNKIIEIITYSWLFACAFIVRTNKC